ncbi:hypothetical protein GCM10028857_13330 [Salinarchaeum chitinilyticum]
MIDYYIKCVNKGTDGDILSVGYGDNVDKFVNGTKTKETVISDIDDSNKNVKTCYYSDAQGGWVEGDDVHTVDGEYIRTDGNQIRSDNLDNLDSCPDDI